MLTTHQIVHHIMSLFGTGAPASALQKGYDGNKNYQRSPLPTHPRVAEDLRDWDHASKYLGKEQYYPDFLAFFQREITSQGWEAVMNTYVFAGTPAADDLFCRLFAGFLHPLIQLMYGLEWAQPAIIAEGLAQACVHGNDLAPALLEAERRANEQSDGKTAGPSIVSLLEEVRADEKLVASPRMSDSNKVRDGVLKRAREEMLGIASKVKVLPAELDERTVEMFNTAVYEGAAAAVHPGTHPKFDFFLMWAPPPNPSTISLGVTHIPLGIISIRHRFS
jgi:hypothetical protein